jgi:hypothetical protein
MAYRSSATTGTDNTNSLVATAPAGIVSGDILIAGLTQDDTGSTIGAPSGWTVVSTQNVTNGDTSTFAWAWKLAGGSEPGTYTFTGTAGANMAAVIAAYSGRNSSPIETSTTNNPNSASPPSSPVTVTGTGFTTANIDDIVWIGGLDTNGGDGSWTAPSGMTLRTEVSGAGNFTAMGLCDATQGSAGVVANQSGTWTLSAASGNYVAFLIALKPPGGAVRHKNRMGLLGVG